MQRDQLRLHLDRRPFEPIRLRMVSGTTYDLRLPESLLGPWHLAFLNRDRLIEVIAIEFVESILPIASRPRNGRASGRRRR